MHRLDDLANRAFEIIGHFVHIGRSTGHGADLRLLLLGLQALARDRVALEHRNRVGHLADLVAAADAGHFDVELAAGERVHRDRDALKRPGKTASAISSTSAPASSARWVEAQVCALRSSI